MSAPIFTDEQYAVVAARDAEIAALTERYVPLVEEIERLRAALREAESDLRCIRMDLSDMTQVSRVQRVMDRIRVALSSTRGGGADE